MRCYLCRHHKFTSVYKLSDYQVIRCQNCGLMRRNLKFTPKQLRQVFSAPYFLEEQKNYFNGCFRPPSLSDQRIADFLSRLRLLAKHYPKRLPRKKKILDIGCASGVFLNLARQKGWRVKGIEISPFAASFARSKFRLPVFTGTLTEAKLKPASFPVITVWEVLPYIEDPRAFFAEINRILMPGGLLAIQLTVVDSLLHSLANLIYQISQGKFTLISQRGYPFQNAHHFTRATLKQFLNPYHFHIIAEENLEINYRFSALPQIALPLLIIISALSRLTGKTIQYRVLVKKA